MNATYNPAKYRADDLLRSGFGHDELRNQLRVSIAARDECREALGAKHAEAARLSVMRGNALASLNDFASVEAARDAARVAAIRAGRQPDDAPFAERLAKRDAAETHLADLERAVAEVTAEIESAGTVLAGKQESVQALAAAVTAAQIEAVADRLGALESKAVKLRGIVHAAAGTYVSFGFTQGPFHLPVSARTKLMLNTPPPNAKARSDNPALRAEDVRTREAFVAHASALLVDADAPLATRLTV